MTGRRCIHGRTKRQACAKCNAMDAAPAEGLDDRWYGVLEQVHLAQIVHDALGRDENYHGEPNCGIVAEHIAKALRAALEGADR